MRRPSASPRSGLRRTVHHLLVGCVWDRAARRVESIHGQPIHAWLTQVSAAGLAVLVEWEAGTLHDLGVAVPAAIPHETLEIIQGGRYEAETGGSVLYRGQRFYFALETVGGVPSMLAVADAQ